MYSIDVHKHKQKNKGKKDCHLKCIVFYVLKVIRHNDYVLQEYKILSMCYLIIVQKCLKKITLYKWYFSLLAQWHNFHIVYIFKKKKP